MSCPVSCGEPRQELGRVARHPQERLRRHAGRGDETGRVPRRAAGQLLALDRTTSLHAELRQVVGDAGPDRAAPDDDDLRALRERVGRSPRCPAFRRGRDGQTACRLARQAIRPGTRSRPPMRGRHPARLAWDPSAIGDDRPEPATTAAAPCRDGGSSPRPPSWSWRRRGARVRRRCATTRDRAFCGRPEELRTRDGVMLTADAMDAFLEAEARVGHDIVVVQSYRTCREQALACERICDSRRGCPGLCAPPGSVVAPASARGRRDAGHARCARRDRGADRRRLVSAAALERPRPLLVRRVPLRHRGISPARAARRAVASPSSGRGSPSAPRCGRHGPARSRRRRTRRVGRSRGCPRTRRDACR